MIVRFFANLREITGKPEIILTLENATIKEVLEVLSRLHGEDFRNALFDAKGELYVRILINGRNIDYLGGLESIVAGKDTVSIFPPVAGGRHAEL